MTVSIALIVSLCSGLSMGDINKKKEELEAKNPGAKVSVRVKKCDK